MVNIKISKYINGLKGNIEIPADKSISHRAVILSALANGTSIIKNFSSGADPHSTLNIFSQLGIEHYFIDEKILKIKSFEKLKSSTEQLDCGNSGTTMRLLAGVLAGQSFNSTLIGDESLSKRPMKRVLEPLKLMGANIQSKDFKAPLKIFGTQLQGIDYISPLASAQVKSCVLLAGLNAQGITKFTEPYISRNHTELMLKFMGAEINTDNNTTTIQKSVLEPREIQICGDISSAAYFIVAGLIVPNSDIILKNVGLNPTRTGLLDVVRIMGGDIEILDYNENSGEIVGDIRVKYSYLKSCKIGGEIIPRLIDELPVIAVLATQAQGQTTIKDADDLRNKESDRIASIVCELKKLGCDIVETPDGFVINGKTPIKGGVEVETYHDHRLAMSLYVAGLLAENEVLIKNFQWVDISFPEFLKLFNNIIFN